MPFRRAGTQGAAMDPGSAAHHFVRHGVRGTKQRNETMNFDDTPQEAEFRATARAWIAANAPKQYEDELRQSSLGRTQLKNADILNCLLYTSPSPRD